MRQSTFNQREYILKRYPDYKKDYLNSSRLCDAVIDIIKGQEDRVRTNIKTIRSLSNRLNLVIISDIKNKAIFDEIETISNNSNLIYNWVNIHQIAELKLSGYMDLLLTSLK